MEFGPDHKDKPDDYDTGLPVARAPYRRTLEYFDIKDNTLIFMRVN
jgi:hypothetical protein